MMIPQELLRNPYFSRYYRTWEKNKLSIVFVPLAQLCREYGLFPEAKKICEEGLHYHPNSISGQLMLARIQSDLGNPQGSLKIVERILEEFPGQQEAQSLLEKISGKPKKTPIVPIEASMPAVKMEAPKPMAKVIEREASSIEITDETPLWENVTMAQIYAKQGEIKTARRILKKLLEKNPQDTRALQLFQELSS